MCSRLFLIMLAGAAGTLLRYGLGGLAKSMVGSGFPWGTLLVNGTGCFLAGLLWTLFEGRWPVEPETRTLVFVGFMGAFTTFSAYVLETGELMRSDGLALAAGNVILQNGLGIAAFFAGVALGKVGGVVY